MAKDSIHYAIKDALLNNGWEITDDPFTIDLEEDNTFFDIDLAAEKAETTVFQKRSMLAIEIKSFSGASVIHAFHEALGQFLNYQAALKEQDLDHELFLAISVRGWERLNSFKFIMRRVEQFKLKFIVVNLQDKKIEKWIK
jgi:hypothetical protein